MCGIAGIRRFDGAPVDQDVLRAMAARLIHRGPDDEGLWVSESVGLVHRRLSIIDVTGSPQPMASPDERWQLSFNGEILNYQALRSASRHRFRTNGDTEVLAATLSDRGSKAVRDLVGQFAFAAFDRDTGGLLLARDRLGILPLYYVRDDTMIAFASEIKALLPALARQPTVDPASVADFLTCRSVHAPFTLFEGVRKVRPGEILTVRPSGRLTSERYWSIPTSPPRRGISDEQAIDEVDASVTEAVRTALVADVPVGSYLSGGLDSSLVASIAALQKQAEGVGLHTFAAGFTDAEPGRDELPGAREVADTIGSTHHEIRIAPEQFAEQWSRLIWHRDAPLSEPADVAVHLLAQAASEHVKVVLSGEGADEIFAGYPKYRYATATAATLAIPTAARVPAVRVLDHYLPASARRLRVAVRTAGAPDRPAWMQSWFAPFTDFERRRLLGADVVATADRRRASEHPGSVVGYGVVDRMLRADSGGWLADNLLERGDRMTMAASIELRPPLLDHRLVELAFSLPTSVKLRGGTGKWVLRQVARRYLPDDVVQRPKNGFPVPLAGWFRGPLRDLTRDALTSRDSFVSEMLDRRSVLELLESHERGRRDEAIRLWTLVGLELWHRAFIRGPDRAPEPTSDRTPVRDPDRRPTLEVA